METQRIKRRKSVTIAVTVVTTAMACLLIAAGYSGKLDQSTIPFEQVPVSGHEFPDVMWKQVDPETVGMDPEKLALFREKIGWGSYGCVIRYGFVVDHWDTWLPPILSNRRGWGSASKAFFGTLALFGIQEARLSGLDERISDLGWDLKVEDQTMTIRQLMDMTSGYTLPESPGERYAYNDYGVSLLKKTLIEGVYEVAGERADSVRRLYTASNRFGPLQFEDLHPFSIISIRHGGPRLNMTPCDYGRFGHLLLNRGRWKGKQVIDPDLVDQMLRPSVPADMPRTRGGGPDDYLNVGSAGGGNDHTPIGPGVFGAFWWFNRDRKLWPDVPPDAFQANGHWNRHALTVIPSLELVIAWRASNAMAAGPEDFPIIMNEALEILVDAVESDLIFRELNSPERPN